MKTSPFKVTKQNLSPSAAKKKAERDLAYAKSPTRRWKKADAQKKRRKKSSSFLKGKDYDHTTNSFVSVAKNRGGFGKGTK
tara:strand:+ start:424 stop:666 length:243 start_codon:yes stop_codon:yes gene_type:complete